MVRLFRLLLLIMFDIVVYDIRVIVVMVIVVSKFGRVLGKSVLKMIWWCFVFMVVYVLRMLWLILCSMFLVRWVKKGVVLIISGGMVLVMFSEVFISYSVKGISRISKIRKGIECSMLIISDSI